MGVEAEREDEGVRAEARHGFQRTVEGAEVGAIVRTRLQRKVDVETLTWSLAPLVGIARLERIVGFGVAVDRDHQDVRAAIEDLLRAVAVMGVDIEDRDAPEAAAQTLRRDCRVVEVAEAACPITACVVAGGPASLRDNISGPTVRPDVLVRTRVPVGGEVRQDFGTGGRQGAPALETGA